MLCPDGKEQRVSYMENNKPTLKFNNLASHLKSLHPYVLTSKDSAAVAAAAPASGAGKRKAEDVLPSTKGAIVFTPMLESEFLAVYVKALCLGGYPLSWGDNLGFKYLCDALGLPRIPRTTATRHIALLYQDLRETIMQDIGALLGEVEVTTGGSTFAIELGVQVSLDGWQAIAGQKMESVLVHGGKVQKVFGRSKPELRPAEVHLGLQHFVASSYTAQEHADMWDILFSDRGLSRSNVFMAVMDTTATNPAILKTHQWAHVLWQSCDAHVMDLCTEDSLDNPSFKDAYGAANAMGEFLRASEKRFGPLLAMQRELGVPTPLRPVPQSNTRFLQSSFVMRRIIVLWPSIKQMRARLMVGGVIGDVVYEFDPPTMSAFNLLCTDLAVQMDTLIAIDKMMEPFIKFNARIGSSKEYTMSLQRPLFHELYVALEPFTASLVPAVQSVARSLTCSILTRMAPLMHSDMDGLRPAGMAKLTGEALREKLSERDEIANAAAALDPSCWATFVELGGSLEDAESTIWRHLIRPRASVTEGGPFVPEGAASAAAFAAEIKRIRAQPKPSKFMSDGAWAAKLDRLVREATDNHAQAIAPGGVAVLADPLTPLRDALEREFEALAELITKEELATDHGKKDSQYGSPLGVDNGPRYQLWPALKPQFPILFAAASMLLCAKRTSISNERLHSVAGRINSKLRASLTPASIEMLTLSHMALKDAMAADVELKKLRQPSGSLEGLDEEQIATLTGQM